VGISRQKSCLRKKQKTISTRRKIEQLHTNKKALEEKLREIEHDEKEKFHLALGNVKSKTSSGVTGWLIETVYRARITVNDSKEHYADVMWSAYTGRGHGAGVLHALLHLQKGQHAAAATCSAAPTLRTARCVWSQRAQSIARYATSAALRSAPPTM
jgi:hypothetical protein